MIEMFRPTRSSISPEETHGSVKILSDFDKLLTSSVGFRFRGKVYVLKPVDVGNFMELTRAYHQLLAMVEARATSEEMNEEQVYEVYYNFIHPICPDFTYADLRALPIVLLNNLIHLVFRQLSGDPSLYTEDEDPQKKKLTYLNSVGLLKKTS